MGNNNCQIEKAFYLGGFFSQLHSENARLPGKFKNLRRRIYKLGLAERGLEDLFELLQEADRDVRKLAAWELALWHLCQYSKVDAQKALGFLRIAALEENSHQLLCRAAIIESECHIILGDINEAESILAKAIDSLSPHADLFLAKANASLEIEERMVWLNKAFALYGLAAQQAPLFADTSPIVQPQVKDERLINGPQVTVIMSTPNAGKTIRSALDSLLAQTWKNYEILIVDEGSTDETLSIVREYLERDLRIRLIKGAAGKGPYEAHNLALRVASGDYVTSIGSNEWSHPERLEQQVTHLIENPMFLANTSQQLMASEDLNFLRWGTHQGFAENSDRTLLFNRNSVLQAIGYWDKVLFGADSEFKYRIQKAFSDEAVAGIPSGPLSLLRLPDDCLSRIKSYRFGACVRDLRREYQESYKHHFSKFPMFYHDFFQENRPFPVPGLMQSDISQVDRHFDVVLISDFRLPGGTTTSNIEEIKAQKEIGIRTALVQMPRYGLDPKREVNSKIRDLIDGDRVQMLVKGEQASCSLLIIKYPPVLQERQDLVTEIEMNKIFVIMNQTPMKNYGMDRERVYSLEGCQQHLMNYYGKTALWYPIGPMIRDALYTHHNKELREIPLAEDDWVEIINTSDWRRIERPPLGRVTRIGRHSRDDEKKWPDCIEEILAVYPEADDIEVHILGGAAAPLKKLGRLPYNWNVMEFDSVSPKDFLKNLDVFVYFIHPDLVESFGRVVIEAMAVGVPVILPSKFNKVFADAAVYAKPIEVRDRINELMKDEAYYEWQVSKALSFVEQNYGYEKHASRLRKALGNV